ncbi:MAG: hypothetical protein DRQ01_09630 [Ignavibacteriae bacterium]|nr:MAG: hypothetical protein DRQ01_09630 [Ignavibacteriota bacterium]
MKKFLLTLVSLFFLFTIGCQENSLIEPLTSEVAEKENFQEDTYLHGFIKLDGMLADPSRPFNCCLEIRGEIEYEHRIIYLDPDQPSSQYYVSLNLAIEAELLDPYSPTTTPWVINEISTDKIDVQPEQVQSLIKYFRVQGRDDTMFLVCKFIVTTDYVTLDGMWL